MELDFKDMLDIDIDNFLSRQSILEGNKIYNKMKELISYRVDPDITFKELRIYSKIKYTVNAVNITNSTLEYFNYELTPNVKVIDAIKASSCLPMIFPPCKINGNFYQDGGFCNNCPLDTVDELETVAFTTSRRLSENNNSISALNLILCLVNMFNKSVFDAQSPKIYTILGENYNPFNINQTKDDVFDIYMQGYINSKNILFKNHIALPTP
jgi:predicted acylesterase/phospholipase RssA